MANPLILLLLLALAHALKQHYPQGWGGFIGQLEMQGDDIQDRYQMPGGATDPDDEDPSVESESRKRFKAVHKRIKEWSEVRTL